MVRTTIIGASAADKIMVVLGVLAYTGKAGRHRSTFRVVKGVVFLGLKFWH